MGEHDDSVYIFDENSHEIPFDPDFRDISELFTDLQDVFDRVEEPLTRHSSTDDEQVNDSDDVQNQATSENFLVFEAVNQDDTTAELMETREYLPETINCEEVPPEGIAVDGVNEKNHEQPPPPLQVTEVTKKSRTWNRTNACPYCRPFILITNFTRHLKRNHAGEDEVLDLARIVAESDSKEDLKIRKKRRTELTEKLRLKANYAYNVAVMNKEVEGSLLPVRRSNCTDSVMNEENHATCAYCQGLFARNTLYLHVPICKMNTSKDLNTSGTKRRVLRTSAIMLSAGPKEASKELKELVFPRLQHGEVSLIAKSDPLIVQFASRMIKKHFEKGKINYIKNCMRDLARFFIEMKKIDSNLKNLKACFQVKQYNNVILTIQCMCGIDYDTNKVSSPSDAARLKGAIAKCIDIIYCNALMDQTDHVAIKSELDQFMHLLILQIGSMRFQVGQTGRKSKTKCIKKKSFLIVKTFWMHA
nr:PREDICTED: uncharacterized protein LOC109035439 [Bemisia tabaci]